VGWGTQTPLFQARAQPAAPTAMTPKMLSAFLSASEGSASTSRIVGRDEAAAAGLAVASVGAGEADVGAVAAAEEGRFG
jgi:hypothetical protein